MKLRCVFIQGDLKLRCVWKHDKWTIKEDTRIKDEPASMQWQGMTGVLDGIHEKNKELDKTVLQGKESEIQRHLYWTSLECYDPWLYIQKTLD